MLILNVGVGMTFSGGIIDLTLFGILQGNERTNWIVIPLGGAVYFAVYFFLFRFLSQGYYPIPLAKLNIETGLLKKKAFCLPRAKKANFILNLKKLQKILYTNKQVSKV